MIFACFVVAVIDGDTLRASCPQIVRVRLADVDAPDRDCPALRAEATARLAQLAPPGARVTVSVRYADRWGRAVADVTSDAGDLGTAMVAAGMARRWPHDSNGRALAQREDWC